MIIILVIFLTRIKARCMAVVDWPSNIQSSRVPRLGHLEPGCDSVTSLRSTAAVYSDTECIRAIRSGLLDE